MSKPLTADKLRQKYILKIILKNKIKFKLLIKFWVGLKQANLKVSVNGKRELKF